MPFSVEVTCDQTNHEVRREGYVTTHTSHYWFEDEGHALAFAREQARRNYTTVRYRWCSADWKERARGATGPYVRVQPEEWA